jgi:Calcineurin-like phosphoesterase superfamily domain
MTRIAVITDVHANLPALEATLAEIEPLRVDGIYCGGDLVGYGPHPSEVCTAIEALAIPTIYGNYDYAIARDIPDCGCAYVTQHDRMIGQLSVDWSSPTPTGERRTSCASFPSTCASSSTGGASGSCTDHHGR